MNVTREFSVAVFLNRTSFVVYLRPFDPNLMPQENCHGIVGKKTGEEAFATLPGTDLKLRARPRRDSWDAAV